MQVGIYAGIGSQPKTTGEAVQIKAGSVIGGATGH